MTPVETFVRRYLVDEPYRRLTDDDLWTRFRDHGDEAAFRVFLERIGGRAYHFCRTQIRNEALCDEVFQDALCALARHRQRIATYGQAVAWFYETAGNAARSTARQQRRWWHRDRAKAAMVPEAQDAAPTVEIRDQFAQILGAMHELRTRERRCVELVYLEGMTHQEAALALNLSRGSVGTYVNRGLDRLRRKFGNLGVLPIFPAGKWSVERIRSVAEAAVAAPMASGGWLGIRTLVAGAVAVGLASGVGTLLWSTSDPKPVAPLPTKPEPARASETLSEKNERLARSEVVPELSKLVQSYASAENPFETPSVRAFGSQVECIYRTDPKRSPTGRGLGLKIQYCVFHRQLDVAVELAGDGSWKAINPDNPIVVGVNLSFLRTKEAYIGGQNGQKMRALFERLPTDARAERAAIEALFGEEPAEKSLTLPSGLRAIAANPDAILVETANNWCYRWTRKAGWETGGSIRGMWFPVVVGERLFSVADGAIWIAPFHDRTPKWKRLCPTAEGSSGEYGAMASASGRLFLATNRGQLWSHPADESPIAWTREPDPPLGGHLLSAAGDKLIAVGDSGYLARPAADPMAPWTHYAPFVEGHHRLVVFGDRLLAISAAPGPIYARPLAAKPEVRWQIAGKTIQPGKP